MAQIRLSEEPQKQLKDGSVGNETKRLFQNFGKHQEKKLNSTKKKKSKKITPHNYVSENWVKYSEKILKIALESAKKAYEYTVSLRSQKLIGRFEILDGLNSDIKTKRIFVTTNTMQLRERIEEEHRVMLKKIYENSYTAIDNIAKLLRTGQIGQFIAEDEVDTAIVGFITLSLVKLDAKNIDTLFSDILAYKVRTLEECKKIADEIEKYRETAIERLCARNNYSVAKELASLSHKSNLISLDKDSEKLDEIIKTEEDYLERERIRLVEEEKRKQEAAERASREAKEREEAERKRIAKEELEKRQLYEKRKRIFDAEKNKILHQEYDNILRLFHITSINNLESILANGIFSRNRAENELYFTDIAAEGALMNHRHANIYGVELDHYARCFFNPLPPMYYMRSKEGEELCIIELWVPFEKVSKYGKFFHNLKIIADIDCESYYPRYYKQSIASSKLDLDTNEAHNLSDISWDSSYEAYVNNPELCKAERGTEVLIHGAIPSAYIMKIYTDEDIVIPHQKISELKKYFNSGKPSIVKGDL